MAETLTKPPPRYSCGHLRTEKGKHACPTCLAARRALAQERYRAKARVKHHVEAGQPKEVAPSGRPQVVVSAERKAAAIARIQAAIDGTSNWQEIAARLRGVSRQRVFQLLRWLERNTDSPEARLFREAQRLKREFYRAEKKKWHFGMPMCGARNPANGHACLLPEGHCGEHYNDYRRIMETWSGEEKNEPPVATHHATAGGSGVQTTPSYPFRVGNTTEV
jgi:hypothetical protein